MNMIYRRDICLGMIFKTCEVRMAHRRDNPPSDVFMAAAPPSFPAFHCICVAHLFTSMPGWRAALAAEWNDNEDSRPLFLPVYAVTLTLICSTPGSPQPSLWIYSNAPVATFRHSRTLTQSVYMNPLLLRRNQIIGVCWQGNCHPECHTHADTLHTFMCFHLYRPPPQFFHSLSSSSFAPSPAIQVICNVNICNVM